MKQRSALALLEWTQRVLAFPQRKNLIQVRRFDRIEPKVNWQAVTDKWERL
jgi:hypothetical protein